MVSLAPHIFVTQEVNNVWDKDQITLVLLLVCGGCSSRRASLLSFWVCRGRSCYCHPRLAGLAGEQEAGVGSDLPTIPEAANQPWEHHRPSFGQGIFLDTLDEILRPASTCIDCLGKVRKSCCRVCFPVWERWFIAVLIV